MATSLAALEPLATHARASATFTVNSTGNASDTNVGDGVCEATSFIGGICTLRAALQEANASPALDTVQFSLAFEKLSDYRIAVPSPLQITSPVVVDGLSWAGKTATRAIRIDIGTGGTNGFQITDGTGTVIQGLEIVRFDAGIWISGAATGTTIRANFIGTNAAGTSCSGASCANADGVRILGSSGNTIGGPAAADRNVISQNSSQGVRIEAVGSGAAANNNVIQGNYIGTKPDGATAYGNSEGVSLQTMLGGTVAGTQIGGSTAGAGNVISGNTVGVFASGDSHTTVKGNLVGTDKTGAFAVASGGHGLFFEGSSSPVIGGTSAADRNIISGNNVGLVLQRDGTGTPTTGAVVQGNYMGTNKSGTSAVANHAAIYLLGVSNALIGGTTAAARNVLSGNGVAGLYAEGDGTDTFEFRNNYVGTDKDGTTALPNGNGFPGGGGVHATGVASATIANNVISGHTGDSIGVELAESSGVSITGNLIGTDKTGLAVLGNENGIVLSGVSGAQVGGSTFAARNVVSGNSVGIAVVGDSTGVAVQGNYAGVDITGLTAMPNEYGIVVDGGPTATTIGGTGAGEGNVVSGNLVDGVHISGLHTNSTQVIGNIIGTNYDRTGVVPNGSNGVRIANSPDNRIGGAEAGAGNYLAGNVQDGILVGGSDATENVIHGNEVTANGDDGVHMTSNATDNDVIGNHIHGNMGNGITVNNGASSNRLSANSIHGNQALSIDLNDDGTSANDPGDTDSGGNRTQNKPVLTQAGSDGAVTIVKGSIDSRAGRAYSIEFYSSLDCGSNGVTAQGRRFLGAAQVTTPANSTSQTFVTTLPAATAIGEVVTATATDILRSDTSEFSGCSTTIALPTVTVDDVSQSEGSGGGTKAFTFSVSLSAPPTVPVTLNYSTVDGTATGGSTGPWDYTPLHSTAMTFDVGDPTSKTVTVAVRRDPRNEDDETFTVQLADVDNATFADDAGLGTIVNDDPEPVLSIGDVSGAEGDADKTIQRPAVTLSAASGKTVTVDYATANGSATAGPDYVAKAGTLTFPPGTTKRPAPVPIKGDTTFEPDETYFVMLSNAVNASLGDSEGQGTIFNDDPLPAISIEDAATTEGTAAKFKIKLDRKSYQPVSVTWATANGSAEAGKDYTAKGPLTATVKAGALAVFVSVPTKTDAVVEGAETFLVNLTSPVNATIADAQGNGTINDPS